MFEMYKTSELIEAINSLLKLNMNHEASLLYKEALDELEHRSPIMASLYAYRASFGVHE